MFCLLVLFVRVASFLFLVLLFVCTKDMASVMFWSVMLFACLLYSLHMLAEWFYWRFPALDPSGSDVGDFLFGGPPRRREDFDGL